MYHCSTMPMSAHIANGLFGAVVIEPPHLPRVDRSYVLVQSELYLGEQGGEVDVDKLAVEDPDLVVFNGFANQYDDAPLTARVGERVRVWVLDAGPNRPTSFHVVGGQFDTTYSEGAYLLRRGPGGAQSLGLQAAQGGFVELTFPEPGDYPFVSHLMIDAERGAHGRFRVTPSPASRVPALGVIFSHPATNRCGSAVNSVRQPSEQNHSVRPSQSACGPDGFDLHPADRVDHQPGERLEPAVLEPEHPVRHLPQPVVVGDDHDRAVVLVGERRSAGERSRPGRVEVRVGSSASSTVSLARPGDRDPLLLSTGHLRGAAPRPGEPG